jgi:hypothetical protein
MQSVPITTKVSLNPNDSSNKTGKKYGWLRVAMMVFNASYILVVSFIGGGKRSTKRKPLTNFISRNIMLYRVHISMHVHSRLFSGLSLFIM